MDGNRNSEDVLIFIDDGSANPFETTRNFIWYNSASPVEARRAWREAEELWEARVARAGGREIRAPRRYVNPTHVRWEKTSLVTSPARDGIAQNFGGQEQAKKIREYAA